MLKNRILPDRRDLSEPFLSRKALFGRSRLFSNDNQLFRDYVRLVRRSLVDAALSLDIRVDSRDFVRFIVDDSLKVDLVNDRVQRIGKNILTNENIKLDNLDNIGANKICAVLGRDDPKDIFDLYTIYCSSGVHWPAVLSAAEKKCSFDMEELRFRLESFPISLLDILQVKDPGFVSALQQDYRLFINYILSPE